MSITFPSLNKINYSRVDYEFTAHCQLALGLLEMVESVSMLGVPLYTSFQESLIGGWSWFETSSATIPLRKAGLEAGANWKQIPTQIMGGC